VPSINERQIHESSGNDPEFLEELIDLYLGDTLEQLDLLRESVANEDGAAAARTAHRLKGSSGNVGAETLVRLCNQMEHSGRDGQAGDLRRLYLEIDREFALVKDELALIKGKCI
jgi:HPt (histidine-containing phosphotransfer) domain-containing protein